MNNDDLYITWRELGEKAERIRAELDEIKKSRRAAVISLIERKKAALKKEQSVVEERPGSPRAIEIYQLPDPWNNYYYREGLFYTRSLVGQFASRDVKMIRQIGEGETDVLTGESNLIETLLAIPDSG